METKDKNITVTKKGKIRHFDFAKKPVSPCFLMNVAKYIISFPDLKKRGLSLKKTDMEKV